MEAYALFARGKEAITREEEQEEDIGCASESSSVLSSSSSSVVELADDASSSGSTGHFEMASLMTQLPIKRGLSMFFDGKSQSFASLAAVSGLEDLPKPPSSNKRLKTSRSCGVGLKDARRGLQEGVQGPAVGAGVRLGGKEAGADAGAGDGDGDGRAAAYGGRAISVFCIGDYWPAYL